MDQSCFNTPHAPRAFGKGCPWHLLCLVLCLLTPLSLANKPLAQQHFDATTNSIISSIGQIRVTVEDKHRIIWFGGDKGLASFDGYSFNIYHHVPDDQYSLSGNAINSLLLDSKKQLWVGTQNKGLSRYNPSNDNFTRFVHKPSNPDSISSNHIGFKGIIEDKQGNLWFGTNNGGLNRFNPDTEKFERILLSAEGQQATTTIDSVSSLFEDTLGTLWMNCSSETQSAGLCALSSPQIANMLSKNTARMDNSATVRYYRYDQVELTGSTGTAKSFWVYATVTLLTLFIITVGFFTYQLKRVATGERKTNTGATDADTQNLNYDAAHTRASAINSAAYAEDADEDTPLNPEEFHILIVDDEVMNRRVLTQLLSPRKYQISQCSSGTEALEVFEKKPHGIDLILLDIMMPDINGYVVCERLRKKYSMSQLPILFLTANSKADNLSKSYRAGGNDFLTKPTAKEELFCRIETHLKLLKIGRQYADANKALKEVSITDELTKLHNRLHFNHQIEIIWALSSRVNSSVSIILCDIDFFKNLNDTHGHLCGDECLRHTGKLLKEHIRRAGDFSARFGGEEFVIVHQGATPTEAQKLAEMLREKFEQAPITWQDKTINLTISIGIYTCVPTKQMNIDIAIHNADQALYRAKANGRNCCVDFDSADK